MKNKDYITLNNLVMQKDPTTGFYQLDKDKEAVESFMKEVESKIYPPLKEFTCYYDKLVYLCKENYYISSLLRHYSKQEVNKIAEMVYGKNFKFESYMAISKFYESYSLKTDDKKYFIERYEDRIIVCALFLAKYTWHEESSRTYFDDAYDYAESMITQCYQPATPTFLNSGRSRAGALVSCYLLAMDDSLNSINYNISTASQLSKVGGGVAISLSRLRARNEDIKGIANAASGVIPPMKLLEDTFSYVNQLG